MKLPERTVEFFEKNRGSWISEDRLADETGAGEESSMFLSAVLKELVSSGYLIRKRKSYLREKGGKHFAGTFSSLKGGGGFVIPRNRELQDVFIPASGAVGALNGDMVICRAGGTSGKRDGEVVFIVKRNSKYLVGIVSDGYLLPFGGAPPVAIGRGVKEKGVAIVELAERADGALISESVRPLGDPFDAATPIKAVETSYGLNRLFSQESESEAGKFGAKVKEDWLTGRKDFRELTTVTIDPSDAKDFDDAISLEKNSDGGFRLFVHIADVSFFVKENGSLDREARERGNSVYLPGKVYPMIPPVLSDGLCSLNEDEERLCVTCEMSVDPFGVVKRALFFESVIRSMKRLSYEEAEEVIAGNKSFGGEIDRTVLAGGELAALLSKKCSDRGALDFDLPEPHLDFGPEGVLERILPHPRLRSHRLIEEFMLLANAAAAEFLKKNKRNFIYRVHEEPDEDKLEAMLPLLNSLSMGASCKAKSGTKALLQRVIASAKGKPYERLVSYQILRAMMRARYSETEAAHYGLALSRYCHFTSPIRRYPDLLVHRVLKSALRGTNFEVPDLEEIAAHTTETERLADEAEREAVEWMTLIYLQKRLGDDFKAMITGFTKFGVKIELADELIGGVCPFSFMEGDHYLIDKSGFSARGKYTSRLFKVGQMVSAKLAKIDLFNKEAHFVIK